MSKQLMQIKQLIKDYNETERPCAITFEVSSKGLGLHVNATAKSIVNNTMAGKNIYLICKNVKGFDSVGKINMVDMIKYLGELDKTLAKRKEKSLVKIGGR